MNEYYRQEIFPKRTVFIKKEFSLKAECSVCNKNKKIHFIYRVCTKCVSDIKRVRVRNLKAETYGVKNKRWRESPRYAEYKKRKRERYHKEKALGSDWYKLQLGQAKQG